METDRLAQKRAELQAQYTKGQQILAQHQTAVEETKLKLARIEGALVVLKELEDSAEVAD